MGPLFMLILGLLAKLGSRILLVMFVLWLVGFLYPFVAVAVGIPQATFYDFAASIFRPFGVAFHDMYDATRCVG
jgi:hypothetical protein